MKKYNDLHEAIKNEINYILGSTEDCEMISDIIKKHIPEYDGGFLVIDGGDYQELSMDIYLELFEGVEQSYIEAWERK